MEVETDLDTTQLHQHNDQSSQSRSKPEGRWEKCYHSREQPAEGSSERLRTQWGLRKEWRERERDIGRQSEMTLQTHKSRQ